MLFYEVKLIDPKTKEIYYVQVSEKPVLPSEEIQKKYSGSIIVINTTTSKAFASAKAG